MENSKSVDVSFMEMFKNSSRKLKVTLIVSFLGCVIPLLYGLYLKNVFVVQDSWLEPTGSYMFQNIIESRSINKILDMEMYPPFFFLSLGLFIGLIFVVSLFIFYLINKSVLNSNGLKKLIMVGLILLLIYGHFKFFLFAQNYYTEVADLIGDTYYLFTAAPYLYVTRFIYYTIKYPITIILIVGVLLLSDTGTRSWLRPWF
ncbi:hypothetical protein [Vagococcus carniphilus]|uniref:hypothetical protein n=1 Tax=Vagococcus carniphilus TaxID=218144 RepID=UPI00288F74B1|nr:hypothetical protein [Vagococcus carniphilus]MDT2814539.1 hypothetical protein [Vagococcus carniphilus]MDT2864160.1 hypothetical protein [Vagococcus carniphilus]